LNATVDIPRLIREIRESVGLSQEKFASRLGVSSPTIRRWENGRTKPSPLALKQIEGLLRKLGDRGHDIAHEYFGQQKH
jgi:DNA-binding transcriptional regulator YiaG